MPSAAPTRPTLVAAAGSHAGLHRENNEDRYHCDARRGLFMVIDGVGGHAAGEKAAATALAMLRARLDRETGAPADRLREAITLANNEIYRLARTEAEWAGMACVLTVALVRDGTVTIGHVGDTRLYALSGGAISKVTRDHSPVGTREDQGEIDEFEAMHHPRRNEIYRDVGSERHDPGDAEFIDTFERPFGEADALVLCTDGLSDMIPSAEIARIVGEHASDPPRAVERLIEAANRAGGNDNVTAVLVAGPRFAEEAERRARGTTPGGQFAARAAGLGRTLRAALVSRAALFACGLLAGLALASALMLTTDAVPGALLDVARPPGWARTWRVGPGEGADFATIGEALARAGAGDRIEVEPGEYAGPLVFGGDVTLVSRRRHEAVISPPPGAAPGSAAVTVAAGARGRLEGFKIAGSAQRRLGIGVSVAADGVEVADIAVSGAETAAVVFAEGSSGTLSGSHLSGNPGPGVIVRAGATPRLLHNLVTTSGTAKPPVAAVQVDQAASPLFFGNIIAGNADDQVAGLPPERRPDVLRDNVIGLAPPSRAGAAPRAGTAGAAGSSRRRDAGR